MRGLGWAAMFVPLLGCGDCPVPSRHVGRIRFGLNGPTVVSAGFDLYPQAFADRLCTQVAADGGCVVESCASIPMDPDCGQPAGAGNISIGYGSTTLELDPVGKPRPYAYPTGSGPTWSEGDTFDVTAAGEPDWVPAFHETLVAPSTDATPMLTNITVMRASPLVVDWTGGATGTVIASLAPPAGDHTVRVECSAPGASGSMTIPTTVLARLTPGTTSLSLTTTSSVQIAAGDYDVTVKATGNTTSIPGTVY